MTNKINNYKKPLYISLFVNPTMDSLLSNAQRCARKADSLVRYGLFDEALVQLDKSIVYLKELKSVNSRYELIQMLNVQIDAIDRKMRSVAIKRSESLKKKYEMENYNSKSKLNSETLDIQIDKMEFLNSENINSDYLKVDMMKHPSIGEVNKTIDEDDGSDMLNLIVNLTINDSFYTKISKIQFETCEALSTTSGCSGCNYNNTSSSSLFDRSNSSISSGSLADAHLGFSKHPEQIEQNLNNNYNPIDLSKYIEDDNYGDNDDCDDGVELDLEEDLFIDKIVNSKIDQEKLDFNKKCDSGYVLSKCDKKHKHDLPPNEFKIDEFTID